MTLYQVSWRLFQKKYVNEISYITLFKQEFNHVWSKHITQIFSVIIY